MPLPAFNSDGDLPPGVWSATLSEVVHRFGTSSPWRENVARRLERIWSLVESTGRLGRFVVFGSFITDEPRPNDVDILLLMDSSFDADQVAGEARIVFDHANADSHFGASVFWMRRHSSLGSEDSMIGQWQNKRGGGLRGIVEIMGR